MSAIQLFNGSKVIRWTTAELAVLRKKVQDYLLFLEFVLVLVRAEMLCFHWQDLVAQQTFIIVALDTLYLRILHGCVWVLFFAFLLADAIIATVSDAI